MLRKRFWVALIGTLLMSFATVGAAQAQSILYGAASPPTFNADGAPLSSPSSLYTIDPATGKETLVGPIGFNEVGAMDFHPLTGKLYAVGRRPASAAVGRGVVVLLTIDPATGTGTEVIPVPITCNALPLRCSVDFPRGAPVEDVSFRSDGALFATGIFTINLSTGAVTPFIDLSLRSPLDALAFSLDDSMLCGRAFEANFFCLNPANPSAPFSLLGIGIPVMVRVGGPVFGVVLDGHIQVTAMSALDAQPGTGTLFGVVTGLFGLLPPCSVAPNFPDGCLFPPIPKCLDVPCLVTAVSNPTDTTGFLGYRADAIGPTIPGLDAIAWSIPARNTPAGTNVTVQLPPVTLTFGNVTQAGNTTLTTSSAGPPPPSGFKLGNPPTYFELSTTAVFSGPIQICIDYGGIAFGSTASLKLQHFENGAWVDVTASLDTVNKVICGVVASLSPFAIFEPEAVANQAPVADAGADQIVECNSHAGTNVTLNGSASLDPDGDSLSYQWKDSSNNVVGNTAIANVTLPLGTHAFTLTVDDGKSGSASDTVGVTVRDTTAPSISISPTHLVVIVPAVPAPRASLGLPNPVVADACDPAPAAADDAPANFSAGVHTITFKAADASGNSAQTQLTVEVLLRFSSLDVRAEVELGTQPGNDQFEAQAIFQLGPGHDGFDAARDVLHFAAGGGTANVVVDLPLSSFRPHRDGKLTFEGLLNGPPVKIQLRPLGGGIFQLNLEMEGLNLAGISNPLSLELRIGDDIGQGAVVAEIEHD